MQLPIITFEIFLGDRCGDNGEAIGNIDRVIEGAAAGDKQVSIDSQLLQKRPHKVPTAVFLYFDKDLATFRFSKNTFTQLFENGTHLSGMQLFY